MDEGFLLSVREGVTMSESGTDLLLEGPALTGAPRATATFRQISPSLGGALRRLAEGGAAHSALVEAVLDGEGPAGLFKLNHFLERLAQLRFLCHTADIEGRKLATVIPTSERYLFPAEDPIGPRVLSRFAVLRREADRILLESPLGHARVVLHAPEAIALVATLAVPRTAAELAGAGIGIDADTAGALLRVLEAGGALSPVGDDGAIAEDTNSVLRQWDPHDLWFHSRSRLGRHANPFGGTYRFKGILDPQPALKPIPAGPQIELPRPALERLKQQDVPFTAVLEGRRSVRDHGEAPLTLDQLGEFLFRAARVREYHANEQGESAPRPYPGGGALWELEVYPVVDRCDGVPSGLYHYDPRGHRLTRLCERDERISGLLEQAYHTIDRRSRPQVLLVITARFQRIQWKYQSMSYSVMLKDVGVLFQNFYLVATAMGLAPCALGGGNSDLFAAAAGLDYYAETSIGEFTLGRPAAAAPAKD